MDRANKVYQKELKRFLEFLGRAEELNDPNFAETNLLDVTPEDIRRYFNLKAFGTIAPTSESLPTHARANTLKSMKKMLSAFMPRRMLPWDEIRREGNPTRSPVVNDVIKLVMKCEVRRQGVESKARRPIEFTEFMNALKVIRLCTEFSEMDRYRLGSVITLQWHLVARVDDMMKLRVSDLSFNPSHHFTLLCQMRWSKNISEERDAPRQIVLASMDDRLCPLLSLAVYLETMVDPLDDDCFLYGNGNDGHRMVRSLLGVALDHCDFRKLVAGNLGTHSIRKGAATYCAKCGVSKDHIELRGRWRGHKKQVDTYIDIERSFPDAQVAARLCGPNGAARYTLVENTWCNPSFLVNIVAPNCARAFSNEIAQLLAIPLLYAAVQSTSTFDNEYPLLPEPLQQRILNSVRLAANIDSDSDVPQYVEKVAILPSGFDGDLRLVDMGGELAEMGGQATSSTAVMAALLSQSSEINALKRRIEEMHSQHHAELASLQTTMRSQLERLNSTIKRIAVQPVVRSVPTLTDPGAPVGLGRSTARLAKRPRDLFELWKEYEFGIGGVKPAKSFNEKERGAAKFVFCFRLKFWVLVEGMLKRGHTSDTAIDAIYLKYGRSKSVTAILTLLRQGKPQPNEF